MLRITSLAFDRVRLNEGGEALCFTPFFIASNTARCRISPPRGGDFLRFILYALQTVLAARPRRFLPRPAPIPSALSSSNPAPGIGTTWTFAVVNRTVNPHLDTWPIQFAPRSGHSMRVRFCCTARIVTQRGHSLSPKAFPDNDSACYVEPRCVGDSAIAAI